MQIISAGHLELLTVTVTCYQQMRIKVARFFNTYGPNMHPHDGHATSHFIVQALQNRSIKIYGDGFRTGSFCYVHDHFSENHPHSDRPEGYQKGQRLP
jgi:dTDP-D-glucose 4,6-dehydratase